VQNPHRHGIAEADSRALGLVQVAILSAIVDAPDGAYGSAITTRVSQMVDRDVVDAQVYVALKRLEDRGFVESYVNSNSMPSKRMRGRPRVHYRLTAVGRRALEQAGAYLTLSEPFRQSPERGQNEGNKKGATTTPVVV
jgi:DNA-binding PadR family transcriptional regulator